MVYVVIFHFNLTQGLVPGRLGVHHHLFKRVVHLSQIQAGLLHADERGGHLERDHLPLGGRERNHGYVFRGLFHLKGGIALDNDIVAEIGGHPAVVIHGPGVDGTIINDFHLTALIGVQHQIGLFALGIDKAEPGCMGSRHEFGGYVVVGQVYTIIIGLGHLRLMREPAGTLFLIIVRARGNGHQAKRAIVVNPGRGLMGLLKTTDVRGIVAVGPAVSVLAGLRRPEMRAPRHGNGRIGIAGGQVKGGQGARHGVHVLGPFS